MSIHEKAIDSLFCVKIKGSSPKKEQSVLFTHPNVIQNQDDLFMWSIKDVLQNVYADLSNRQ